MAKILDKLQGISIRCGKAPKVGEDINNYYLKNMASSIQINNLKIARRSRHMLWGLNQKIESHDERQEFKSLSSIVFLFLK